MHDHLLEFSSRAGELHFRQPLTQLPASAGRALDNDFILDDPYVAAHHITLEAASPEADTLLVRDLGSRNGLYQNGRRVTEAKLGVGDVLHLGHSTLRLRHRSEPVPAERVDSFSSAAFSLRSGIILTLISVAMAAIEVPLSQFGEITPSTWIGTPLTTLCVILGWAALWSLLGRLLTGSAHFPTHLAITAWAMLVMNLGEPLVRTLGFSLSSYWISYSHHLIGAIVCPLALLKQLSLVQVRWPRANLPLSLLAVFLPVTFWVLDIQDTQHRYHDGDYVTPLYDPALRLVGDKSLDTFLQSLPGLAEEADSLRRIGNNEEDDSSDAER